MTKIKVCGMTNRPDAEEAAKLNVDWLGFIFYKGSPRAVTVRAVEDIVRDLPVTLKRVGVFVDEAIPVILDTAARCGLDMVQLHGAETPSYCQMLSVTAKLIKAFRVKDEGSISAVERYTADYYLFDAFQNDAFGGTGTSFNWNLLAGRPFSKDIILSGGLTAANVQDAIGAVAPFGVDVVSGIEAAPGKKDKEKMKAFVDKVRRYDYGAR